MENPIIKLSLIIPYYNTYEYTVKLLKELQLQITDAVEVILIDDGCNETRFDVFNNQFKIIHNEHKGASVSYNEGIKNATGKFIGFIDSDDMIMMNYIDELLKAIDADLADEILFDWVDYDRNTIVHHSTARAVWKAVYRKEIVPLFDERWIYHTDVPFQDKIRKIPHTRFKLDKPLYIYRSNREGSISWNVKAGNFKQKIKT